MGSEGIALFGNLARIEGVIAEQNCGFGLELVGRGGLIVDSQARQNGSGILMGRSGRMQDSVADLNGLAGILVDSDSIVTGCVATLNGGTGISLATGGVATGNVASGNGSNGINMNSGGGVIMGNAVLGNGTPTGSSGSLGGMEPPSCTTARMGTAMRRRRELRGRPHAPIGAIGGIGAGRAWPIGFFPPGRPASGASGL